MTSLLIPSWSIPNLDFRNVKGPIEVKLPWKMTDDEFFDFCMVNQDLQIEQNKNGMLIVAFPVGLYNGDYENEINRELSTWRVNIGKGHAPSPSTGFILPDGSKRSPDASWISDEKIAVLTDEEKKKFPPLVPDFVVEVRSESDSLARLKKKMVNVWIKNGVLLAWLIDPLKQQVYIYRKDGSTYHITDFDGVLSGEDVCLGFEFKLDLLKSLTI